MGVIAFESVQKSFDGVPVLRDVGFQVASRSVHFIMGRSGAGKSVLIKQLVGLLRPDAGHIYFDGEDIGNYDEVTFLGLRRRCQLIFQHATLFESRSVLTNITMPIAKRFRLSWSEAEERARQALASVYAEGVAQRRPADLGIGLRKRIAIARAIALKPEVLLYDEPTTGLDPVAARRIDSLIKRLSDEVGVTSVVVSHDMASLNAIADRVTFIDQGRVAFDGDVAGMLACSHPVVAAFSDGQGQRWHP